MKHKLCNAMIESEHIGSEWFLNHFQLVTKNKLL